MKLLDETQDPVVYLGSRLIGRVARRVSLRERDGQPAAEVLLATWRRHAEELRAIFHRLVGDVGTRAPWNSRD